MDQYQELLKALGKADDVEYLFRTQRPDNQKYAGSFYAQHAGNATTGFREPSNETGKGYKLQPKSYRTLYLDPRATDAVHSWFRDQNIATYAVPEADERGRPTGHLLIKSAEDQKHGNKTLGKDQTLTRVPYSKEPVVGHHPLEFGPSAASPRGSSGDVHYGNKITEVHPRPSRLGKAGIAAALAGGAGAASAGDLRRAAGDVAESFLPLGVTPSTLAPGTLTPEQRAASDAATQRKRQQEEAAKMKAQALLRTGVPMPDEYRRGGRVRMI
jgi:hypothetical protein